MSAITAFALLTVASIASKLHPIPVLYREDMNITRVLPENASIFSTTKLPSNKNLMATIANGYVGMAVTTNTTYISGVYNGYAGYQTYGNGNVSHRARIPSTNSISLSFPNYKEKITQYYTLDINDAVYFNSFLPNSNLFQVEQLQFASRKNRNLLVTQININNSANTESLTIALVNNAGPASNDIRIKTIQCPQNTNKTTVCQLGTTLHAEGNISLTNIGIINTKFPSSITVPANSIIKYYFASVFLTQFESDSIADDMVSLYNSLYAQKEQWLNQHVEEWTNIWNKGRIDIIGNDTDAANVYSSLYYIISSIREDWSYGLSPGSLSSNGYEGHIFWDTATWMFPPLLMLHERLGKSALKYRYDRIDYARLNANMSGYDNTALKYPWESALTGIEVCPPPYLESIQEIHVGADIALAIMQYFYATRNMTWLKCIGYPMLKGISNLYVQRSYYDTNSKLYGYINVCGPDESNSPVNNSIYTNNAAGVTMNFSIEVATLLQLEYPSKWEEIANNMKLLFDVEHQYHPEFDGYSIGTVVKQADVILLSFPWHYNMTETVHKNDVLLYENSTNLEDCQMTWSMFAVNWLDLGDFKQAMAFFNHSTLTIEGPFKIWQEKGSGKGTVNFITGMGGYLQSFIFGFGGFRIFSDHLYVNYKFIPWKQMNLIGVDYQYNSIDFKMYNSEQPQSMDVTVVYRNEEVNNKLVIQYADSTTDALNVNQTVTVTMDKQPIKIVLA